MSINDKSENIKSNEFNSFNANEEENNETKNIYNNIYLKTFSNFHRKRKIRIIKNKIASDLYKIKYSTPKKKMKIKNSINNPSYSLFDNEQHDKDNLFLEIKRIQKKIKNINNELKELQTNYNSLEKINLSNLIIIQNLLKSEDNNSENDLNYNSKHKTKLKKTNIQFVESNKIQVLKKQINYYDLTIQENDKKLNSLNNKSKQKRYKELINLLINKDKEINEINQRVKKNTYILFENVSKSKFYNLKSIHYNKDISKLERKLRYDNELIHENNEEIKEYNGQKESLKNNKIKLINKIKLSKKEIKELNQEENNFDKQIEENRSLIIEKEKNENILENLRLKKDKMQTEINKVEKKLLILRKENKIFNNDLEDFGKEWPLLLKKSKIPGINQVIMKGLEKEIERNKNEIDNRNKVVGNKEKNMSEKFQQMIDLNNNYREEIDNYHNEKSDLIEKLNDLKIVLKNNKNKNEALYNEYTELEKNFEKNKDDYAKKQKEEEEKILKEKYENEEKINKEKKDLELKEKNFKEDEEKYKKEINELKEKNESLKSEKEELIKNYDEKMKNIKQMNEAEAKLKNILLEIQKLSSS